MIQVQKDSGALRACITSLMDTPPASAEASQVPPNAGRAAASRSSRTQGGSSERSRSNPEQLAPNLFADSIELSARETVHPLNGMLPLAARSTIATGSPTAIAPRAPQPLSPPQLSVALGAAVRDRRLSGQPLPLHDQHLIKERYPDHVDIYDFFADITSGELGLAMASAVAHQIATIIWLELPPWLLRSLVRYPEMLLRLLVVKPRAIVDIGRAVNGAYHAGLVPAFNDSTTLVLPTCFDYGRFDETEIPPLSARLDELVAGKLYRGYCPGDLSPAVYKQNAIAAEIFDRLAQNANLPENQEPFTVVVAEKACTTVADFVAALSASGHTISAKIVDSGTDVLMLRMKRDSGDYAPVAADLMFSVGNAEAAVPVLHSGIEFEIRGPVVNAKMEYFHSLFHHGFVASDTISIPAWFGRKTLLELNAEEAMGAARLAGFYEAVATRIAQRRDLWAGGYATLSTCNDSVALVAKAVTGKAVGYPLLFSRAPIEEELASRINGPQASEASALLEAVRTLPCDIDPQTPAERAESLLRLRHALPWTVETAPTAGILQAITWLDMHASEGE